jgi:hypothetical protein
VRLTKPALLPWLAVGLLPDGMVLLGNQSDLMLELGDFERYVAWALLESLPRTHPAASKNRWEGAGRAEGSDPLLY